MWELPDQYFSPVREAMQERVAMVPYLYTAMHRTWQTGLQAMHPMYYEWPETELACDASSYDSCQRRRLCQFMLARPAGGPGATASVRAEPPGKSAGVASSRQVG
mmetsp:Transcript_33059/g.93570  ORF Transcript_33059/g.93570 Transcript_33059/m.93570 type:complete len:105 (+) Transcript_33059:2157-2471(+)